MKKKLRILFLSALFAASPILTACSLENSANSNTVADISTKATPAPVDSPARSDLAVKLQNMGVSNTKKDGENKSNAELLSAQIEEYKRDYKNDPEKANAKLNLALESFNDSDVKKKLLKIKDFAYSEAARSEPENNAERERQRKDLEDIIASKTGPLDAQLKALDEKLDKNDSSGIPIAIFAQTGLLAFLIIAGLAFQIYRTRKLPVNGGEAPSNLENRDGGTDLKAEAGDDAPPPENWPRAAIIHYPDQGKQDAEKSADLSKIEKALADISNTVGQLSRQITYSENSIVQKLSNSRHPVSESPPRPSPPLPHNEVGAATIFTPTLVKELKEKYQGRARPLEKDKFSDLLVPSYREETFLLTENQGGAENFYLIIPTKERFRRSDDYYNIQAYFDCDNAGAGELLVEKPAQVESEGDGWKLRNKGKISVQ